MINFFVGDVTFDTLYSRNNETRGMWMDTSKYEYLTDDTFVI